jgi:hypothetical protein
MRLTAAQMSTEDALLFVVLLPVLLLELLWHTCSIEPRPGAEDSH